MKSPFLISLIDLPRQEGASIPWDLTLSAPAGLGGQMMSVAEGTDIDISLQLSSVSEGVYISGRVQADLVGRCSRCLCDISDVLDETVEELVYYPERYRAMLDNGDEEAETCYVVADEQVDIEPIIRDVIVLALPFGPLCEDDCPGLCSECGERYADLPVGHAHEKPYDARFDALAVLEDELKKG